MSASSNHQIQRMNFRLFVPSSFMLHSKYIAHYFPALLLLLVYTSIVKFLSGCFCIHLYVFGSYGSRLEILPLISLKSDSFVFQGVLSDSSFEPFLDPIIVFSDYFCVTCAPPCAFWRPEVEELLREAWPAE